MLYNFFYDLNDLRGHESVPMAGRGVNRHRNGWLVYDLVKSLSLSSGKLLTLQAMRLGFEIQMSDLSIVYFIYLS